MEEESDWVKVSDIYAKRKQRQSIFEEWNKGLKGRGKKTDFDAIVYSLGLEVIEKKFQKK